MVETLSHRHIGVVDEEFAVSSDAMEMFGVTSDSGWHARSDCEYSSATTFAFRGDYTPALAKHSKRFSLEDALSIGVGRMQRNFDPMRQQVERWRAQQLSAEAAKLTIYGAFIEGDLEVPKHLARRVHELSFNPQHEEFEPRTTWSGIGSSSLNAEVNAFDRLRSGLKLIKQRAVGRYRPIRSKPLNRKTPTPISGRVPGGAVLRVVLAGLGSLTGKKKCSWPFRIAWLSV